MRTYLMMRPRLKHVQITLVVSSCLLIIYMTSPTHWLNNYWESSVDQKHLDIDEHDVLVVVHIPRTGMTSLTNWFIKESSLSTSCHCPEKMTKCKCLNKNNRPWLFNSYNTSGFVCGEHADFTSLTSCPIDHWFKTSGFDTRSFRRYHLMTMLREPTARYISEWLYLKNEEEHFFKNEPRLFNNASIELQKKRVHCFVGIKTSTLSLLDFLNCRENPANNRQTRMLANLTAVNSMGLSGQDYEMAMLHSAQQTLLKLPFYGIINRPRDTFKLLEHELGIRFLKTFPHQETASEKHFSMEPEVYSRLKEVNHLDFKLFRFAEIYFDKRMGLYRKSTTLNIDGKNPDSLEISDINSYIGSSDHLEYKSHMGSGETHKDMSNEDNVLQFLSMLDKNKKSS
ncbi:Heparan-sulfate 6-O-sulfotransferase 3-B [Bulinus truncatus]|nr:Heparan-sulfate 6-O-sulfotransferase 3-B [Bulinus truncatus]